MSRTVQTPVHVRFGECDYYQHVNNNVYLTYTDIGLSDFLREIWPDLRKIQYLVHIVHISIDFKSPATFDDHLIISTTLSHVGETSITFKHTIVHRDTGLLVAEAKKVCVILDSKTGKKCKVPKEFLEEK